MSGWFQNRRQEFIAATLRQFGQVRRTDLMREFDISLPQASADIQEFLASDSSHVSYDLSAKAYVLEEDMPDPREDAFRSGFAAGHQFGLLTDRPCNPHSDGADRAWLAYRDA